jgi:hypothetical protein
MISGTKIPREKRIQIIYSTYTEFSFHEIPREKEKKQTSLQLDQMPEGSPNYDRQ